MHGYVLRHLQCQHRYSINFFNLTLIEVQTSKAIYLSNGRMNFRNEHLHLNQFSSVPVAKDIARFKALQANGSMHLHQFQILAQFPTTPTSEFLQAFDLVPKSATHTHVVAVQKCQRMEFTELHNEQVKIFRHFNLNNSFQRALSSNVPSTLKPPGISRTDGKRPRGSSGTSPCWTRWQIHTWQKLQSVSPQQPKRAVTSNTELKSANYIFVPGRSRIVRLIGVRGYYL